MDSATIQSSLLLCFVIWSCIYVLASNLRSRRSSRAPPGPYRLPIIGNLHLIGQKPHQSFAKLAKTYGPIMSVKLGRKETVVVSSAAMAREVLQKNDQVCSSRGILTAGRVFDHHKFSMVWLNPASSQSRNIRKICKEQIFATHRLDATRDLRQENFKKLREYVNSCSISGKAIDVGEAAFTTSLNLLSRSLFSVDFANYDSNSSQELKEIVFGILKNHGATNLSDYFPALQLVDPQGIMRVTKLYYGKFFDIFDGIIKERLRARGGSSEASTVSKNDWLEALLDETLKNETKFSIDVLKHLLLDLFVAGTDPVSGTVEWAMAELIRSPEKMERARAELKQVVGEKGVVQESDISRLPYLQALVKETLRLHPAAPLLVLHEATEDVEINGYIVPKNAQILVNVWASGRDEATWTQPEMFNPERFLDSQIDVKGQHFELIPFSSGRRMCAGFPLGYRMVHLMLASLIHNTEWKLEGGMKPQDLDMEEEFGLAVQLAVPLKAIPVVKL